MTNLWTALSVFYCRHFHHNITRPINGTYICTSCWREYPVNWHAPNHRPAYQPIDRTARQSEALCKF